MDACCIGKARLSREICLAWTSSSCNLCYEECPYEAISLDGDGHPVVDEARCNGCGVCEVRVPCALAAQLHRQGTARAIAVVPVSPGEEEVGR